MIYFLTKFNKVILLQTDIFFTNENSWWCDDLNLICFSASFAGLGYLSLYIAGKLGTFNSRGRGCIWKLVVSSLPLFLASWVASTRFTDYHHHADGNWFSEKIGWLAFNDYMNLVNVLPHLLIDILVGSLLGCIIAYTSYRIYYPSLTEEFSQYPYKWLDLGILQNDAQSEVVARNSRVSCRFSHNLIILIDYDIMVVSDEKSLCYENIQIGSYFFVIPVWF